VIDLSAFQAVIVKLGSVSPHNLPYYTHTPPPHMHTPPLSQKRCDTAITPCAYPTHPHRTRATGGQVSFVGHDVLRTIQDTARCFQESYGRYQVSASWHRGGLRGRSSSPLHEGHSESWSLCPLKFSPYCCSQNLIVYYLLFQSLLFVR